MNYRITPIMMSDQSTVYQSPKEVKRDAASPPTQMSPDIQLWQAYRARLVFRYFPKKIFLDLNWMGILILIPEVRDIQICHLRLKQNKRSIILHLNDYEWFNGCTPKRFSNKERGPKEVISQFAANLSKKACLNRVVQDFNLEMSSVSQMRDPCSKMRRTRSLQKFMSTR